MPNKYENVTNAVQSKWGYWLVTDKGNGYKIKILSLNPNHSTSYQKHFHRSEVWTVVSGEGIALLDDKEIQLYPGVTVTIEKEQWHQIINNSNDTELVINETQFGSICEEEDILRNG